MRLTLTTSFTLLAAVTAASQVGYGGERAEDNNQAALAKRMMILQECSITGCWRDKPDLIQWNRPTRQPVKSKNSKKHSSKAKRLITTQDCPTTGCDGFPPKFSTQWRWPKRKPSKTKKHSSKAKRSGQVDYQDVDDFAQEGFGGDDEYNQRIGRTLGMIFGRLINRGFVNN
ncbi:hypothetical protein DL89DRAFT_268102 [Linderina pennispora]|uniref:Uncharacterized protein n=1 Tax=Linderina pennispora TaxID=61395 RepID=A0A1Y1W6B0_9FUNG|nr:uncharacterized protein DL89DRAFT_268102 [Linderina pennispora]ORX69073.1 hypothetical protein DL89DRAFT_268102 [Linderina pennispora]